VARVRATRGYRRMSNNRRCSSVAPPSTSIGQSPVSAQRALRILEATGLSQFAAIRAALLGSAERVRKHGELAAELASLEAEEVDRAEMLSIACCP